MRQYLKIFIVLAAFSLIFAAGCDDRGINTSGRVDVLEGGISPKKHSFSGDLTLQIENKDENMLMSIYLPYNAIASISDPSAMAPIPLLILLAPQDGGQFYFFNHGLKEVADELISNGTIEPMAIACIPNDDYVGGYFYAGHYPAAGNYDNIFSSVLVDYLESVYPMLLSSPDKRGIGGIGQGAYGAFRAAILNPGMYSSVSAVDGPLDFDGPDGKGGFYQLFDDALLEQGTLSSISQFRIRDTMHVSRMLIGAAYAFSPHDTTVTWHRDEFGRIVIDSRMSLTDNTTLVNANPNEFQQYFHLPFTVDGVRYTPIWNDMWLPNNLENLLTDNPGALTGTNLWVATSPENTYCRFHEQTASFISTLQSEGYPVSTKTYYGAYRHPAYQDEYLYDLLKEILVFHNENFKD